MATTLTARVRRHILDVDLELDLAAAPVTVLFGPSGAGKTTLLRAIAGLDVPEPSSRIGLGAQMWFDGRVLVPARRRRIGFLFQNHVLFPHLSVLDNVGYGLGHVPRRQRRTRAEEALERAHATHLIDTPVPNLSGGESQRVALARALAPEPRLLLLDEPLSALDTPTRTRLRDELRALLTGTGIPSILVTHDRAEALALGDVVAVLLDGRLHQLDAVTAVFSRPADRAVAAAVGTETTLPGRVRHVADAAAYAAAAGVVLAASPPPDDPHAPTPGSEVLACIRAEDVALSTRIPADGARSSPRNHLAGTVTALVSHGPLVRVELDVGFALAAYVTHPTTQELALAPGLSVTAEIKAPAVHLISRGSGAPADRGRPTGAG